MTEQTNEYKHLRRIADDPPRGKFVALSDGRARMFREVAGVLFDSSLLRCNRRFDPPRLIGVVEYLTEAGYTHWVSLPDDFKFFCEGDV